VVRIAKLTQALPHARPRPGAGSRPSTLLFAALALAVLLGACSGQLPNASWPGLTASDTTAYLAAGQFVYAVDVQNGTLRWRYPEKASAATFYGDPALTADGRVVLAGSDKAVHVLDASSGVQVWTAAPGRDPFVAPALSLGQDLYVPDGNGTLYALSAADGATQWTFHAAHAIWAAPVPFGESLLVASLDHTLYALNAADGRLVWSRDMGAALAGGPVVAEDLVLIGTFDGRVVALDAASGREAWSTQAKGWVWGAPVIVGKSAIFGDLAGNLQAVESATGRALWQVRLDGPVRATPAADADRVYIGTEAGTAYALDVVDGTIRWQQTIGGKLYGDPRLAGGKLLFTVLEGEVPLAALDPQNGAKLWSFVPPK
jgi:outer membrane protein assembly factor BamB